MLQFFNSKKRKNRRKRYNLRPVENEKEEIHIKKCIFSRQERKKSKSNYV